MATRSSVLACRIPGMAEPGGLLSMGTESDTTEETWQQQEQQLCFRLLVLILVLDAIVAHKWLCIERFH